MKNRDTKVTVVSAIQFILSLALTVGSKTVISACPVGEDHIMNCHWAEQAIFGAGIALTVIAVLLFVFKDNAAKAAISACMIPVAVFIIAVPNMLIPLCMMPSMKCISTMRPSVIVISVLIIIVSAISVALNIRKKKD